LKKYAAIALLLVLPTLVSIGVIHLDSGSYNGETGAFSESAEGRDVVAANGEGSSPRWFSWILKINTVPTLPGSVLASGFEKILGS